MDPVGKPAAPPHPAAAGKAGIVFAPLALLAAAVLLTVLLRSLPLSTSRTDPGDTPIRATQVARSREQLDADDRREAYERAQAVVLAGLPGPFKTPPLFPDWSGGAPESSSGVRLERLTPTHWRVRSYVEWLAGGTPAQGSWTRQPFEADLLHGPADDRWRLVDTEMLPVRQDNSPTKTKP